MKLRRLRKRQQDRTLAGNTFFWWLYAEAYMDKSQNHRRSIGGGLNSPGGFKNAYPVHT